MASVSSRLRRLRLQRGFSAPQLASRAGVTRQTIYAMEAGSYVPNTLVALRLAQALETTVEALFSLEPAPPKPTRPVELLAPGLSPGQAVRLCTVGRKTIAVPSPAMPLGLPDADAVLVSGHSVETLEGELGRRLLIAGCDPGLAVLARHLARRTGVELITAGCSSTQALGWLKAGQVHVAGSHLPDSLNQVRKTFPRGGYKVVSFAAWEEGLVVAKGNPHGIRGVEDLASPRLTMVNREPGAGSRILLDAELRRLGIPAPRLRGYQRIASGHIAAAWQVSTGAADCCVANRAAGQAFGLDFLPLVRERFDLVIPHRHFDLPAMQSLLDGLQELALRRELQLLGGYDTTVTGQMVS